MSAKDQIDHLIRLRHQHGEAMDALSEKWRSDSDLLFDLYAKDVHAVMSRSQQQLRRSTLIVSFFIIPVLIADVVVLDMWRSKFSIVMLGSSFYLALVLLWGVFSVKKNRMQMDASIRKAEARREMQFAEARDDREREATMLTQAFLQQTGNLPSQPENRS